VSESTQSTKVVRFGVFEVDLRTAELRKHGVHIRLSGQPFQVLEALLLRPGELVTREELKQKLWPSDSFGDFEHGINAAINRVREALGDSSDNPRFVETLPRRGYRFIATVENGKSETKKPLLDPPLVTLQNGQTSSSPETIGQPSALWRRRVLTAASLLLLLLIGLFLLVHFRPVSVPVGHEDLNVTPLTTLPGEEDAPSFSPDGSQVVFAWDGGNAETINSFNLYVKVIGSEKVDQLTRQPGAFIFPAWSPDGRTIAFARQGGESPGIFSVPARGGAERKLADARLGLGYSFSISLSWSSDGRQLLYYTMEGLRILTPENGQLRAVDTPGCGEASAPSFSPDGRWIAFDCETNGVMYIDLLPVAGGHSRHLVQGWGVRAWSVDSQRIIFAPLNFGLAEINISGGKPRNLAFAQDAFEPAIASHGNRLAFVKGVERGEIWRLDTRSGLAPNVFAPSSLEQVAPDISPDGKRIAFEADRSGFHEVWVANLDGSDAVQLSNFRVQLTGTPRWSPDGRQIVFDSRVSGKPALYLVDPGTALPKQISTNGIPAALPSWSPDGKWIYFTSGSSLSSGDVFVYRVPSEGGHPERVTQNPGYNLKQSKDGRFIYFFAGETDAEIHVVDVASGQERGLKGMPRIVYPTDWTLGSKGIYFIDWGPKSSIDFFDFASERVTRKIPLDKQPIMWGGLSLSADESWLMYSQTKQTGSDLMLVEGFR
jgi:Tol biopolymer transport system component/DNA-binding winged helix-turn-helix (wHTH) protein